LLKKDKQGDAESTEKLPQMAKQLEVSLYREAQSFEAYMDMSTLKQRLQQIAVEVSRKTRNQGDTSTDSRRQHYNHERQAPPQSQQQTYQHTMRSDQGSPFSQKANNRINGNDMNSMVPSSGHPHSMSQGYPDQRGQQHQPQPPQHTAAPNRGLQSRSSNDPDVKVRIRHKQQRLLLLHHSAKCPHEDGRCSVTPHCEDMKLLWRHMEGCKDNNCKVPHCFSSRAILSHYRKCRDVNCPACGPVRETVRKSRTSSSSSRPSTSTGPMMSSMRDFNHQLSMQADPLGVSAGGGSFSGSTSSRNPQVSMPPPVSQPSQVPQYSVQQPPEPTQQQPQQQQQSTQPQQRYNGNESNRSFTGSSSSPAINMYDSNLADGNRPTSSSNPAHSNNFGPVNPLAPSSSRSGTGTANRNDADWQKIRHKQQRLLLLRHASRCQHESGKCPVTPHCASMKRLWEHIAVCKNQACSVQHCLSSRYVLSHYRRCKDTRCPACGPVRETIRKSTQGANARPSAGQLSFDNPTSGDVVAPPRGMSPSLSVTSSSYEPQQKRTKIEQPVPAQPISSYASPHITPSTIGSTQEQNIDIPSSSTAPESVVSKPVPSAGSADHSLLNSFTVKQLETHLASLDRKTQLPPAKLKSKCLESLKGLQTHQHGWVFNCPVDPVELGLPDYYDIIKKPMDLGSIQKRLENGAYHSIEDFEADVILTFDNAMTYNENGSVVYTMANELKVKFAVDYSKLLLQLEEEDQQRRQNDRACTLCGCEKLLFEPPVYFCNGMNCQSQRIRRNSHFFIGGNNQYFWCSGCYNELDDKIPIELADMSIMKADLIKKKNDEVHEESWVQCDSCERWVHQICGLFNTRQNKEHHSEYCCPKCLCARRKENGVLSEPKPLCAADLPRTTLSEWLEKNITKKVERRKRELAEERSQAEVSFWRSCVVAMFYSFANVISVNQQGISLEEATRQTEAGGPVYIRQVTAMDRKLEVRELMRARYAHKNYPEEFPFRCKCIVVFQELDGVDVLLFALYVYEHGEDNPPPNQRVVYISYLDSVHFMRPRRIRTFIYHEILIAYLDYARRRGFATAHIWACPPLKGDDYIFYAKPEDQKTPRDSRLRQWYIEMLVECQKRNIVGKVTNMYDLYFANEKLDATAVPYLEGDYFPGEAENIIKMLEDGGKKGSTGIKKKKSKNSVNKGNTGTRSTGVDEEALLLSGMMDGAKSFKDLDRDQVMVKLGETIQPMKESFIVAFLNWSGAKEEDLVVPESIEKARIEYNASKDDGDLAGSKRDAIGNVRDVTSFECDGSPVKVIDDDAEDLDCEFLNNRQAFLNLCRGNHYQFDEVRRAKHTSMMVLWHLHNRDAPKFVQQCVACSREILSGKRYHCNTCSDYDLCQECYSDPNVNRGVCNHQLQAIAVESDNNEERSNGLTDAQRMERQRKLLMHIQLIEHASRCNSKSCSSSNCAKMKSYLKHSSSCRIKVQGGCKICKRIWTLLRIHAQKCKDQNCPIPQCNAIREKMRQLQKQQQAMDDRRRLEMNRHMRFSMTGGQ
jgi:E1A/CREB-binding protein